jgi:DNA-binding CsgD family transcriptional regulator
MSNLRVIGTDQDQSSLLRDRHRRVLDAAADGKRNREIAHSLGCPSRTVDGIVSDAIRRLGARNRPHAVAMAIEDASIAPVPNTACVALLTPRQLTVAEGVAAGKTAGEIAGQLGISRQAVEAHRLAARRRASAPTSSALAAIVASHQRVARTVDATGAAAANALGSLPWALERPEPSRGESLESRLAPPASRWRGAEH